MERMSRICLSAIMLIVGTISSFEVFGDDAVLYMNNNYYQNPEIQRLIAEKQQKIAILEKCGKNVKGFKIAGISTIGSTAVGTIGNIALSNKRDEVSNNLQTARQKQVAAEEARKKAECEGNPQKEWHDGECKDRGTTPPVTETNNNNSNNEVATEETTPTITLDVSKNGVGLLTKDIDDGEKKHHDTYDKCSVNNNGDWCAQFDKYVVNGTSTCVSDYSNETYAQKASNQNLNAAQSTGQYCYCKMTSWAPNDGSQNNADSSWVFLEICSDAAVCAALCSDECASYVRIISDFRGAVFKPVAN